MSEKKSCGCIAQSPEAVALVIAKMLLKADGKNVDGGLVGSPMTRKDIADAVYQATMLVRGNKPE